jgi:hypothetical protein
LACLLSFGFPSKYVNGIRECVTNPKFSIVLNGSLVSYFKGRKGLRQDDPISLFLFVIAMEAFTRLVMKKIQKIGSFKFHPQCGITYYSSEVC